MGNSLSMQTPSPEYKLNVYFNSQLVISSKRPQRDFLRFFFLDHRPRHLTMMSNVLLFQHLFLGTSGWNNTASSLPHPKVVHGSTLCRILAFGC